MTSVARLLRFLVFFLCVFTVGRAFAAGGTCPSGANYTSLTNTGASVTLASYGITNCYFVAANGSDSNNGTSESTPWLHAPFMPNCSGNCATVQAALSMTAAAGTGFIFRGGDTWHFGASTSPSVGGTWEFNSSPNPIGTASNPIYVGVDQTWYSGSSWARPVMNGDNPVCNGSTLGANCFSGTNTYNGYNQTYYYAGSCAYQMGSTNNMIDVSAAAYYIIDNFEMTGLCLSASGQTGGDSTYVRYSSVCNQLCTAGVPLVVENLYIHGASHLQYAAENGSPGCTSSAVCINIFAFQGSVINGYPGETIQDNVVDFSDSDPIGEGLCFGGFWNVAYNVFRYTTQCIPSTMHTFHDNLYEYFFENGHSNLLEDVGEGSGVNAVYNNVFRHVEAQATQNGGTFLWLAPPTSGTADYVFNNVGYDVGALEYVNVGGTAGNNAKGNYTFFNNTWQSNVGQMMIRCALYTNGTVVNTNEHYIDDSQPIQSGCSTQTSTTTLWQSNTAGGSAPTYSDANAAPHFDQYSASQTYAYSPTASTNSTVVGAGTNEGTQNSAFCSALATAANSDSTLSNAASACQSPVPYLCGYVTSSHTVNCVTPTAAPIATARPASTAWNIGAYQLPTIAPNPPTNVIAAPVQ